MHRSSACLYLGALLGTACARSQPPAPQPAISAPARQAVQTDGFELSVPAGWRVKHTQMGIEAHSPGDAIELVVSGAYPAADAETTREIVSVQGGVDLQAWTERRVGDLRVASTTIVGSTRFEVSIVAGADGHVVVTTETEPEIDAATVQLLREVVDSVRIRKVVAERTAD
ncbi:MAG: hypothetical protein IAG13_09650 [Deltaproteobacteria bacterium]|nr:hypothetical protein [Nannocystaceae bacterium]